MNEKCSIHKAKKIKIQSFPTGFKTSIVCVRVGRERERERESSNYDSIKNSSLGL
jgi:hypothetical protein